MRWGGGGPLRHRGLSRSPRPSVTYPIRRPTYPPKVNRKAVKGWTQKPLEGQVTQEEAPVCRTEIISSKA